MIGLLDDLEAIEYEWYVGDPVPTTALWKRAGYYEMPIYQNTRGQAIFNALSVEEGNIDNRQPTGAFWQALEDLVGDADRIDLEGCEWYEREFLGELVDIAATAEPESLSTEIGQLFAYVRDGHYPGAEQADLSDAEEWSE